MAEAFRQSDPQYANVTIEFTAVPFEQLFPTIETAVAAGAEMDLFAADGPDIKHYAYNEAIVSLADYYTEEELAEWVPQSVEEGSFNGTFYAPPLMQSCSLMFYNKDMTDAAGLEPPQARPGLDDGRGLGRLAEDHRRRHRRRRPRCLGPALGPGLLVGRLRARHHAPLGWRERQPVLPGHGPRRHHLPGLPRHARGDRLVRGLPGLASGRPRGHPARADRPDIFFSRARRFTSAPTTPSARSTASTPMAISTTA